MNLNDSIKQLEALADSMGNIADLIPTLKAKIINESELSQADKLKVNQVIDSMDFDELSKQNLSDAELMDIIKKKI